LTLLRLDTDRIERAIFDTLVEGNPITGDLREGSTGKYMKANVQRLK
jgi:hypothetical protein